MGGSIVGIVALIVGLCLIVYRDRFAKYIIKNQNKTWGFKFADNEITSSKVILLVIGFMIIVIGLLSLLHIIKFK